MFAKIDLCGYHIGEINLFIYHSFLCIRYDHCLKGCVFFLSGGYVVLYDLPILFISRILHLKFPQGLDIGPNPLTCGHCVEEAKSSIFNFLRTSLLTTISYSIGLFFITIVSFFVLFQIW